MLLFFSLFLQKRARQSSTYKRPKTSKDAIGLTHTCITARAPARRMDKAILWTHHSLRNRRRNPSLPPVEDKSVQTSKSRSAPYSTSLGDGAVDLQAFSTWTCKHTDGPATEHYAGAAQFQKGGHGSDVWVICRGCGSLKLAMTWFPVPFFVCVCIIYSSLKARWLKLSHQKKAIKKNCHQCFCLFPILNKIYVQLKNDQTKRNLSADASWDKLTPRPRRLGKSR